MMESDFTYMNHQGRRHFLFFLRTSSVMYLSSALNSSMCPRLTMLAPREGAMSLYSERIGYN